MKTLISILLLTVLFSPASFAQFVGRPFYCMNRYNSVNVQLQGNRFVATLNIPVSNDADGYMGDFIATGRQVIYSPNGVMQQMTAVSNTYYQSHWNEKQRRTVSRPAGHGVLTILFQGMEIPQVDFAIWSTGILRQANGRTINFPLGWCRPPGT